MRLDLSTFAFNNTVPIGAHTPEYNDDTLMQVRVDVRFTVRYYLPLDGRITGDFLSAFFPIVAAGYTGPGDTPPMNIRNPQDERIQVTGTLRRDTAELHEAWGVSGLPFWAAGYSNEYILAGNRNTKGTPETNIQAQAVLQVNQGYAFESEGFELTFLIYTYLRSFWASRHPAVGETH